MACATIQNMGIYDRCEKDVKNCRPHSLKPEDGLLTIDKDVLCLFVCIRLRPKGSSRKCGRTSFANCHLWPRPALSLPPTTKTPSIFIFLNRRLLHCQPYYLHCTLDLELKLHTLLDYYFFDFFFFCCCFFFFFFFFWLERFTEREKGKQNKKLLVALGS